MNQQIQQIIDRWEQEPRDAAKRLIDYYGEPAEYCDSRLIWHETSDGWKRTEVVNDVIPHAFPDQHNDYLEQFIDYRVPVERFSDLGRFDGSVMVDRTKGEISARCGGTSMNFLALNLSHEIVTGRRSVDEARGEYARVYKAFFEKDEKAPSTQGFQFQVPHNGTGDPDVKAIPLGAAAG